ncbi:MAG: NUDIX domain-containing protein [Alphaproteobacteria bacterium]|nr:NUDIX domain-containing protein [Alphaproteobacteria bacterium]
MEKIIKVGVGVYIFNQKQQLLLGLRKSLHGNGTWCPPGGHLEYGESFEIAASRETKEETNLDIAPADVEVIGVTNDFFDESGKHYVTIHLKAKEFNGEVKLCEPDKFAEWRWFDMDNLPENIFLPAAQFLAQKTC